MCEYCDDDYRSRRAIELSEGHEIEIDKDNDLSITIALDITDDQLWLEIKYCPWCGRELEDKK
ncbi:hypothetical protein [Listeria marthii]|uniref:hypothetical protein n=1 Tax=Listeria marthii TaxID=529731 RepID=UPI001626AC9F|nr:hypothetical protein [Listeria marthii]MBC2040779.1 hypothetical protein [Listeria marthii]MBC2084619.1 hypothetical protein [Listeria marthii]